MPPTRARLATASARVVVDKVRRRAQTAVDLPWAQVERAARPPRPVAYDGEPRFALVTVNFSTTAYLKLLLLTLAEQSSLHLVPRVIIVDNGSRDGGRPFLESLSRRVSRITVIHRHRRLHHAVGMRAGVRTLDGRDRHDQRRANWLLFVDTDVAFTSESALESLARSVRGHDEAVLAGEVRRPTVGPPDIQASFFAVRRDAYAARGTPPLVNSGSPALRMQQRLWSAERVIDFRGYEAGLVLHRGRSGVAAAQVHHPRHAYASVHRRAPHFMGRADGPAAWASVEQRCAALLSEDDEPALVSHLAQKLA